MYRLILWVPSDDGTHEFRFHKKFDRWITAYDFALTFPLLRDGTIRWEIR